MMNKRYGIFNVNGTRIVLSDDYSDSCKPYYPTDKCGGCDSCCLDQAHYYKYQVIYVKAKTPDDALKKVL